MKQNQKYKQIKEQYKLGNLICKVHKSKDRFRCCNNCHADIGTNGNEIQIGKRGFTTSITLCDSCYRVLMYQMVRFYKSNVKC